VREDDLRGRAAPPPLRRLMEFEVARARALFAEGIGLAGRLEGRARWMVAAFSAGGIAVLDALARQGYDPLVRRASLSGARKAGLLLGTLWGRTV
jgi:phytoene/squalene synthetase